ncbi:MAG: DUF4174 domain-containing protein [Bacteroidota bacterium]
MRRLLLVAFCTGTIWGTMSAAAQDPDLDFREADHRWQHRLLYVFAPSETDDAFAKTAARFGEEMVAVEERDGLVLLLPHVGTGRWMGSGPLRPNVGPALRARYGIADEDGVVVLVGKDGTEKARYDLPATPAEVFNRIDTMPMRQREMRERSGR